MLAMFQKFTGREYSWSSVGERENGSRWSQIGSRLGAKPLEGLGDNEEDFELTLNRR